MKYFKRLKVYKASNVELDVNDILRPVATSYNWWIFFKVIKGVAVFNHYCYSNSTSRHQWKVRCLLEKLGVPIHMEIAAPDGLQNLSSSIDFYKNQIDNLYKLIDKPRTWKRCNEKRQERIDFLKKKLQDINSLLDNPIELEAKYVDVKYKNFLNQLSKVV